MFLTMWLKSLIWILSNPKSNCIRIFERDYFRLGDKGSGYKYYKAIHMTYGHGYSRQIPMIVVPELGIATTDFTRVPWDPELGHRNNYDGNVRQDCWAFYSYVY